MINNFHFMIMILKYLFDRIFAFVGLLILWPILVVVAVLIKIKMPGGPVFFVQDRVGRNGKLFRCHKFRTMTVEHNGPHVSIAGEERITLFGARLRHHKLDELPELWDVLRGAMSFVGPRPDVPGYADLLKGEDRVILKLRPGITGPATLKYRCEDEMIQKWLWRIHDKVNGNKAIDAVPGLTKEMVESMPDQELAVWYNDNVIYPDKVRINSYYYHHYSFIKDIQMIFATVLGKNISYNGEEI